MKNYKTINIKLEIEVKDDFLCGPCSFFNREIDICLAFIEYLEAEKGEYKRLKECREAEIKEGDKDD